MGTRTIPLVGPTEARRLRRDQRFKAAQSGRHIGDRWRDRGRCVSIDPEVFFPTTADDAAPALALCRECPVLGPCLAAALDAGDSDGVWGGTTPEERRAMRQVWLPEQSAW